MLEITHLGSGWQIPWEQAGLDHMDNNLNIAETQTCILSCFYPESYIQVNR